jgi:hypothetical protein
MTTEKGKTLASEKQQNQKSQGCQFPGRKPKGDKKDNIAVNKYYIPVNE